MKFLAVFALFAIIAATSAYTYQVIDGDYEYEPEYELEAQASEVEAAAARAPRSYGGAKCGKAVVVACSPIVKKVKCKGGY